MNDPHENATWVYNYDRSGNILSKVKYAYTEGELGEVVENIPYEYTDSNWKDKLTAYNGKTITYDAIGNPLNDGERQYEWEAGRRLKKMIVKGDPADGIENGFDEGSATTLKLEFSNGNLLMGEISNTVISAKVYRKDVDVTDEYTATAFNWTRNSGNESVDEDWNAAHSGMKSITVSANELSDDIQIQCTLTGTSPAYGSVDVNDSFIASHTRGEADSNDTLSIEDGALFVTTDDDNYRLSGNELKALYPRLNGTVTANAWIYHTQPLKTIEFKYNSSGLRVQKKVTANGKTEVTDYTLHGKLVTHMTVGNDKLHFFYDAQSRPTKVNFNGTTYTYLHNLQGDVVGIIDNTGNLVVEYKYDAWGKALSMAGILADTLGIRNPFRYRGYVFDKESGLYYLRSRYYNSTVGRFVNADINLGKKGMLFAHSSYTYCLNLLIGYADSNGMECRQCIESVGPSYEIFTLDRDQMAIFATWLLGEYPVKPVDQPFQKAVGNLLGVGAGEELDALSEVSSKKFLKAIPGISLAYDIVEGTVEPYAKYEANSAAWLKESFGLRAVASKAEMAEITCFFGHWTTEIGVRFYNAQGKLVMTVTENVSKRHLRNVNDALSTYFPVKHGHPQANMILADLYNLRRYSCAGEGRFRYSSLY